MQIVSNLHEMLKSVSLSLAKVRKNISICSLQKILPRALSSENIYRIFTEESFVFDPI